MRTVLFLILYVSFASYTAQNSDSLIQNSTSLLKRLVEGDSVIYYQCHVESATQQLTTSSGQTLTAHSSQLAISEKFVLTKKGSHFFMKYYSSPYTQFPSRRFSGLKISEKPYWEFRLESIFALSGRDLALLVQLEKLGKDANEYDFIISKHNKNQIIIKTGKAFKQLGIEGDYLISRMMVIDNPK